MTEQIYDEMPSMQELQIRQQAPQSAHVSLWTAPIVTLVLGVALSALCWSTVHLYSQAYIAIIMPITLLTALTQLSLGLRKSIREEMS